MSDPTDKPQEIKKDDDTRITEELEKDTLLELEVGMSGEREQLPGIPKEYSGWDVYNNEAKKVDTELVNDWRDSLNSLLLFAAIFAAVLTAFIIESKKLLELDPSEAMLDVMISFTNSMANGSFAPYSHPQFEPESSSITINSLFFASLSASLVAALASVVALQWVADYDAAITRGGSSPEDRAKRRQFRHAGVVWWKMSEIIATLPLLLYGSVILFFSGLTLWMWTINHTVGAVVAGGMGLAVLFYGTTTFLSVVAVSAPFRTPLSRLIYSSIYLFFPIIDSLSRLLPIPSSQAWLQERHQRYTGAIKRDDDEVNRRSWLGVEALVWLAGHLSISSDSYDRLLLLVNELRKQNHEHFTSPGFNDAPWFSIFDLLGWKNLNTAGQDENINSEEMRAVAILAHCYQVPKIYEIVHPKEPMLYYSDEADDEYWSQSCDTERTQWAPSVGINSLFLLLRDVPLPSRDTSKQLESTIRLSRWRNSIKQRVKPSKGDTHPLTEPSCNTIALSPNHLYRSIQIRSSCATQAESLFIIAASRLVKRHVETGDKMAPPFLDTLRWHFESVLLESIGHSMDAASCLSSPVLYFKALLATKKLRSLHSDFTLLLSSNLTLFSGVEQIRRVKEVITMLWVAHSNPYWGQIHDKQGMEIFFDANRSTLLRWTRDMVSIPHIHDILAQLALAQRGQPDIGSLWRESTAQPIISGLLSAIREFDDVIGRGITPEQHLVLIDLVCQDIELCPPGAFRAYPTVEDQAVLDLLTDPCFAFVTNFTTGAQVEFVNDTGLFKASWSRIATHIVAHYEGTEITSVLKLQAFVWFLAPDYTMEFSWRASREPQVLARIKRTFEYPVNCQEEGHETGEGHLLLHTLHHLYHFHFPVDIPALTRLPMKGWRMEFFLAALLLSDGYQELLRKELNARQVDSLYTEHLLETLSVIKSSKFSLMAILLGMRLFPIFEADLVAFSICVNKALDLPNDPRATSLIPPLVSRMKVLIRDVWNSGDQGIGRLEATKAMGRLHTYLARLHVSSRVNSRVLTCARASGSFSPAIGWLAPHTD